MADKELEMICARNYERRRWAEEAEAKQRSSLQALPAKKDENGIFGEMLTRSAQRCAWALVGSSATLSLVAAAISDVRCVFAAIFVGICAACAAIFVEGAE